MPSAQQFPELSSILVASKWPPQSPIKPEDAKVVENSISVDAYLASCEKDGVDPVRPVAPSADLAKSPVLVVRVPEVRFGLDLFQRMGDAVRMTGLSLGRWLERTVKNALS